jgi:hypothetical protein
MTGSAHPAHSAYVRFLALFVRTALTGKDSNGSRLCENSDYLQISRPIASQSERNHENSHSVRPYGISRRVFAQVRRETGEE